MLTEIQISVGEFWSWLLQSTGILKVTIYSLEIHLCLDILRLQKNLNICECFPNQYFSCSLDRSKASASVYSINEI